MTVLSLRGVHTSGPRGLHAMDLDVALGETVILYGGPGKFAVFRVALGMEPTASGTVTLLGEDVGSLPIDGLRALRARCALVPHEGALISNTPIHGNVALPLLYHDLVTPSEVGPRVREALELVGLAHAAGMRPADLTPVERRMAALARAVAQRPVLALLQDPFDGTDEAAAERTVRAIEVIRGDGAVLLTANTGDPATAYGGRLGTLRHSRAVPHRR